MMEVRPTASRSCWWNRATTAAGRTSTRRSERCSDCYLAARDRAASIIARDEGAGSNPARLGQRVAHALARTRMPARLRVAKPSQHMAVLLHDLLPTGLFTRLLGAYYKVNKQ